MAGQLVVIRHAKAGEAPLDMHRPLTERGHRDAAAIGAWLRDEGLTPDRVVVSPAKRAMQTWLGSAAHLDNAPEPEIDDRIYDNSIDLVYDIVRETPLDCESVVLVGHNPTFAALAYELDDGSGDLDASRDMRHGFPTSAVAVFQLKGPWADVEYGSATLAKYAVPRG